MTEDIRDFASLDLPYRRRAQVRIVDFDSGMKMARLVLREGTRITQIDLDAESARALADTLTAAAGEL